MPDTFDHVAYLTQQIGPRPAGSREEQQAALYIADTIQQESGLHADIEDFHGKSDGRTIRLIFALVDLFIVVLALIFPVLAVPAIAVTLLLGAVMLLEWLDKVSLGNLLPGKDSQNIVAKYIPEGQRKKSRKVVIVAGYDSGKARLDRKPGILRILPVLKIASLASALLLPIVMLIRGVFFLNKTGVASVVINTIAIILVVLVLLPSLIAFIARFGKQSEGANCNAAGVAVLMEAAMRAGNSFSYASRDGEPIIHGAQAAYDQGLVPEGAELDYEYTNEGNFETSGNAAAYGAVAGAAAAGATGMADSVDEDSAEGRLLAAKQAIAALTGKPTSMTISCDLKKSSAPAEEVSAQTPAEAIDADVGENAISTEALAASNAEAVPVNQTEQVVQTSEVSQANGSDSVPDWFKRAQAKARKNTKEEDVPVQRSKFADALDAAEAAAAASVAVQVAESEDADTQTKPEAQTATANGVAGEVVEQGAEVAQQQALADQANQAAETAAENQNTTEDNNSKVVLNTEDKSEPADASEASDKQEVQPMQDEQLPQAAAVAVAAAVVAPAVSEATEEDAFDDNDDLGETIAMPALNLQSGIPALQAVSPVVLPNVPLSQALPSIESVAQQPAPLAWGPAQGAAQNANEGAQPNAVSSRAAMLAALPSLDSSDGQQGMRFVDPMQSVPSMQAMPAMQAAPVNQMAPATQVAPINAGAMGNNVVAFPSNENAYAENVPALDPNAFPAFNDYGGAAGMTGSFAPVGNQLMMNNQGEDMYIDDADDSVYDDSFTDQGAYAGEDYVEMPKKKGFFSKLFKKKNKKNDTDPSAQEWLNVDDDYTANSAGASRGGWESFQPDDMSYQNDTAYQEYPNDLAYADNQGYPGAQGYIDAQGYADNQGYVGGQGEYYQNGQYQNSNGQYEPYGGYQNNAIAEPNYGANPNYAPDPNYVPAPQFNNPAGNWNQEQNPNTWNNSGWNGGAFSGLKQKFSKRKKNEDAPEDGYADDYQYDEARNSYDQYDQYDENGRITYRGGNEKAYRGQSQAPYEEDVYNAGRSERSYRERDSIREFRNLDLDTEVWFVALGSQYAGNQGMKAFLKEHARDLRGALVVELEGLGAGDLSYAKKEGYKKPIVASRRALRFLDKAQEVTGIALYSVDMLWSESAATLAARSGLNGLHLIGALNGKPAYCCEKDDVIENIDENVLAENTDFVMELLKTM